MEPRQQAAPEPTSQEVNLVYLQQLRELDIPEEAAKQVAAPALSSHINASSHGTGIYCITCVS